MAEPLVSIFMTSFNHARFVADAIESVLQQDVGDFEFLIADDGSTDGTADAIAGIRDQRIHFTASKVNRGAVAAARDLICRARGKYIALMNSDDVWRPGKLSHQVSILASMENVAATFGRAAFIDGHGLNVPKSKLTFGTIFDEENRSRGQWLRHFFTKGNCLCHPTMLIRREIYDRLGTYDFRLRQLPDFDMWVRLLRHYSIFVSDRELIYFRVLPGESASAETPDNSVRTLNEYMFVIAGFFDEVDRETLLDGFGDLLIDRAVPSEVHLDIEKVFLLFKPAPWLDHMYKIVGISKMFELMGSPEHRKVLQDDYGFGDHDFHKLVASATAFRLSGH